MSATGDGLFPDPLPSGYSRRVLRIKPGLELDLDSVRGALVVVERGQLELECRSGFRRRFGPGSMITIERCAIAHARNVGVDSLVLVTISRASASATDEFSRGSGSYFDC